MEGDLTAGRFQRVQRHYGAAVVCAAAALIILVVPAVTQARPGALDRSFGRDGRRILGKAPGVANSVAVGRKQRIVVAGGNGDFTVARLLPNGRLDHSFGRGGITKLRLGESSGASSVAIRPNGGIVVAGTVCSAPGSCNFAVSRLKRDGKLNRSFGKAGTARLSFPGADSGAVSVATVHGGKLVVGGDTCRPNPDPRLEQCDIALARLRRGGSLDTSFGGDGKVVSSFARPGHPCNLKYVSGEVTSMGIDSHGRIVVAGSCQRNRPAALARFTPNGHLDHGFGNAGRVSKDLGFKALRDLAIDSRDRIDVTGAFAGRFVVARLKPDGKLDSRFGGNGTVRTKCGSVSLAIDSRRRIVVGGGDRGFSFARITPKGHVDRRFGDRGCAVTGRGDGMKYVNSVAIGARNRIVGAGYQERHGRSHFGLVRLLG